jgi:hypothetical protein
MPLKIVSSSILIFFFLMAGCNSKELTRLQIENDSLRNELDAGHTVMVSFEDISSLLDSIDANRDLILTHVNNRSNDAEFSARLKDINQFVNLSEEKIRIAENALKFSRHESSAYVMLVDALKSEVQLRLHEIIKLNGQIATYTDENEGLREIRMIRENEVNDVNIEFSRKQQELLALQRKIESMVNSFKVTEADACYARARAVEESGKRTKLAPHKRRETYKEALELYKKSLSLGKQEARVDIDLLEKKIH